MHYGLVALACGSLLASSTAFAQDVRQFEKNGYSIQITVAGGPDRENPYSGRKILLLSSSGSGVIFGAEFETFDHLEDAWVTDLDANGRPEVVLWLQAMGSGSYGSLLFLDVSTEGISLRKLPPLRDREARQYAGHDRFLIHDHQIIRRFPIYRDSDPNCCPSGGTAEVTYSYNGARLDR